jgi:hypothetical protein
VNIQTRNIKTQIKIENEDGEKVEIIPLKTTTLKIRVETPDLHNYSLPRSHQPKRVRSYPVSPSDSRSGTLSRNVKKLNFKSFLRFLSSTLCCVRLPPSLIHSSESDELLLARNF